MPFTANVIRVLIASPSDLVEERKVAITTIYEWNAQHAEAESVVLLPVAWETHVTPRSGVRPQAAINEQLVDRSDILVGMFWTKLGTSTGVASSGTVEEIERFIAADKPALLYFSKRPVDPAAINPRQNRKLKEFRDATYKTAVVGTFDSLESLQGAIARHLLAEVRLLKQKDVKGTIPATVTANAVSSDKEEEREEQSTTAPSDSWSRNDYERAVLLAIIRTDDDRFATIDDAYRKSGEFHLNDNAVSWTALVEWARIKYGKGGQLKRLKKLVEENPENDAVLLYLGRVYAQFDQHELAGDAFARAAGSAKSVDRKARCASEAAKQFHEVGIVARVDEMLAELRRLALKSPSVEVVLTKTVQSIAEAEKDDPFTITLLERHVQLNPDDYEARFQLAFKQSEAGYEAIALHHYYKIPSNERQALTWNNIGAAADELGLPTRAVTAYKQAASMDLSLAQSNLGFKLLNAGFLDLAREQCNAALKHPAPHQNVGTLVTTLATVETDEQQRQDDLLGEVDVQVSLLQRLGRAATFGTPEVIAENWQGPDCTLKLTRSDGQLTIKGTYEREEPLLLSLMIGAPAVGSTPKLPVKRKYSVVYSGRIRGHAVIGEVKYDRDGNSLLGSAGEQKATMILSDDGSEISVFENADATEPTVKTLKRIS